MATEKISWASVLGDTLVTGQGVKPTDEALAGKSRIALYFASQSCPWSRKFDSMLKDSITKVRALDPMDTEVVYISADDDEAAFQEVLEGGLWSAVPYNRAQGENPLGFVKQNENVDKKDQGILAKKYGVERTPRVVVLDGETGKVLHKNFLKDNGETPEEGISWTAQMPPTWQRAMNET